jgi:integrase
VSQPDEIQRRVQVLVRELVELGYPRAPIVVRLCECGCEDLISFRLSARARGPDREGNGSERHRWRWDRTRSRDVQARETRKRLTAAARSAATKRSWTTSPRATQDCCSATSTRRKAQRWSSSTSPNATACSPRGHTTRGFLSSPASSGGTRTVPPSDATPRRRSSLRKPRAIHRRTFTDSEVIGILTSNKAPRDQIALRLLLFFGIRKGALRGIRFDDFKPESRELTIVTKGEKIQTLQIVDDAIWELLDELREPGNHYLLPKRKTRKRVPPQRAALQQLSDAFAVAEKHSARPRPTSRRHRTRGRPRRAQARRHTARDRR